MSGKDQGKPNEKLFGETTVSSYRTIKTRNMHRRPMRRWIDIDMKEPWKWDSLEKICWCVPKPSYILFPFFLFDCCRVCRRGRQVSPVGETIEILLVGRAMVMDSSLLDEDEKRKECCALLERSAFLGDRWRRSRLKMAHPLPSRNWWTDVKKEEWERTTRKPEIVFQTLRTSPQL